MEAMKIEVDEDELKRIVEALESNYCAYTRAVQREDARYEELADGLKRKR